MAVVLKMVRSRSFGKVSSPSGAAALIGKSAKKAAAFVTALPGHRRFRSMNSTPADYFCYASSGALSQFRSYGGVL
jgi:hypothetical protein